MMETSEGFEHAGLPLDVVQIVMGYVSDTRSMAAARQVCKAWHSASAAATATVNVVLPGSIQDMRSKLALLLHVMPSLAGVHLSVGSGSASAYPAECFRQLRSFPALKSLDVKFHDSREITSDDMTQLACLTALTRLHLHNISLAAATDSSPLLQLQGLQELSLVHHSKVSALLVGDKHLTVLGRMTALTDLVLQGRMCSASDSGLLALTELTRLHSLAISWVPWQSQITQAAALQLLSALKSLKTLHLGGAELLLPSTPHLPVHAPPAAPRAAPRAAAEQLPHPVLTPQLSTALSLTAAATAGGSQTDMMRTLLLAKTSELDQFKLQFNCCGTGVEKALLALGDVRGKLTGLQWSYAKLAGPNCTALLATCTALTSLKLRLWYQDYNLRPFTFNLTQLSSLTNLRSLVIDKRPPFQQQLPVQQGAITIPLTPAVLKALTGSWGQLQKLQLGLSRADFGPTPLQGLRGFSQLKSLSVHCYDQGYDDGQYMLPVDITCLPASLVKVDLMHAELFSSSTDGGSDGCKLQSGSSSRSSSASSRRKMDSITDSSRSNSSGSSNSLRSCSSSCASHVSSSRVHSCCSSGAARSANKVSFAAASAHAFSSMLSESFSVLSRQASVDNSTPYLDQLSAQHHNQQQQPQPPVQAYYGQFQQQQQQQQQTQAPCIVQLSGAILHQAAPGVSAFASAGGAAAAAAAAVAGSSARLVSTSSTAGAPVGSSSSWLQDLMHSLPTIPASNSGSSHDSGSNSSSSLPSSPSLTAKGEAVLQCGSSTLNSLAWQQSLPPLPEQKPVLPGPADISMCSCSLTGAHETGLCMPAVVNAAGSLTPQRQQQVGEGVRRNPFAAASAAAAVHAAIGGCVAAVASEPAQGEADAGSDCSSSGGKDQEKLPKHHSSLHGSKPPTKLFASQSVLPAAAKAGSAGSSKRAAAAADGLVQRAYLPLLQQLQLKHCSLLGVSLEDIITKPLELRVLQLIEVAGLSPRDVALLPYLATLHRLTLIAAREDAWLGLAPLRLFARLPELRHLDWVVSEKALSGRHGKGPELQALALYPKLTVLTVHTLLGRCEQLHAVSGQLKAGCAVRLMTPAFCEHASKKSSFGIGRLLGAASCLLPGTVPVL